MFKLVIQDDEGKTTVVPLIRDEITIGRKEGNTIRLTERNVSRRHARILRQNNEVQIEDLGSYNGIRVNNARIAERVALRVSDQVQIGDYKLYLKAEGVEQVDDARTMPIERIDTPSGTPTDIITAVSPPPTPPTATPSAGSPIAGLAAANLVGNPARTQVAIADTDPAGRPVASAAAVAALTTPVGYGKLVVLSSNFAGKEFELSRPQMIVGRTDENDIVINHRSISRNHAKLVREPDTGRYTISDLQSSNGVRVNGQDYGKVELRRGDVVDLGHVRLRFVEAGEDFLFSRDAVITDVPDTGSKKGLLVALVLGVLVLGGIGAFFALKGSGDDKKKPDLVHEPGSGTNGTNDHNGGGSGDGSNVASNDTVNNGSGVADINNGKPENPGSGGTNVAAGSDNDIKLECTRAAVAKDWANLEECTGRLKASDPTAAGELRAKAIAENKNEAALRNLNDAIEKGDLRGAKTLLDKIGTASVYKQEAKEKWDTAAADAIDEYERKAKSAAADKKCAQYDKILAEARRNGVEEKAARLKCIDIIAAKPGNGSGTTTTNPNPGGGNPPAEKCDAAELKANGDNQLASGMDAAALAQYEASMRCKADPNIYRLAFMAACKSKNAAKAKLYYPKVPASLAQICLRNNIQVP